MHTSRIRALIAAVAITSAVAPAAHVRAAPRSIYNGDAFASAPSTPSASTGASVERSGGYTHSFAFEVPPGRLGQHPSLALTYRSDGPIYGTVAAGWALNIPSIDLDTRDGILQPERHWTSALAGGQRLIPSNDPRGPDVVSTFRARHDVSNTRYERMGPTSQFEWQARTPDGMLYRFGRRSGEAPVAKHAPLAETVDSHGNTVSYEWAWATHTPTNRPTVWSPRLDFIRYTSNPAANLPPFATIRFHYDQLPSCNPGGTLPIGSQLSNRSGTPIVMGQFRLLTVTTSTVDRTAHDGKVRQYEFLYDAHRARCDRDGAPQRRLIEIRTTGWSPDGQPITVPPTTFGYETDPGNYHDFWFIGGREDGTLQWESNGDEYTMLVDLDGDGRPDRVAIEPGQQECDFYWQRNLGNGFSAQRNHVARPRLPYGDVPENWSDQDWLTNDDSPQGCALNRQRTLYENVETDLDSHCEVNDRHVRTPSQVNWRFIDVDHDGFLDMVAALDFNVASLDPFGVEFEGEQWSHLAESRRSPGSFMQQIRALQDAASTTDCKALHPFDSNGSYPWLVFRNLGRGQFARTPEVIGMPVPLVASSQSGRSQIGEEQVGGNFLETFWSEGTTADTYNLETAADPFALVDIDGDGYQDVVSSFKSAAEVAGGEPARTWQVLRGRPDGLYQGRDGDTPFEFTAAPQAHVNGINLSGGLSWGSEDMFLHDDHNDDDAFGDAPTLNMRSFTASTSGLHDAHGDGLPDFVWASTLDETGDMYEWISTGYGHANMGGGLHACDVAETCAFTVASPDAVMWGGFSNFSSRHLRAAFDMNDHDDRFWARTWSSNAWLDVDADGRADLVSGLPTEGWHHPPHVRYSDGEGLLAPRPLPTGMSHGFDQRQQGLPHRGASGDRLLVDIDGDGRLDSLLRHSPINDRDRDGVLDGTTIPFLDEVHNWSVFRTPGRPEGLLTQITTSQGATTHVQYVSVREPMVVTGWNLPTHAWVVHAVTVDAGDGSPAQVTRYAYGDPQWNQDDKGRWGFRGFGTFITDAPNGRRTESKVLFEQFYAGLASETATYERNGGTYALRNVDTLTWRDQGTADNPIFVQEQADSTVCSSTLTTVPVCAAFGAKRRTVSQWSWQGFAVRFLLPEKVTEVAGSNIDAIGARETQTQYAIVSTGTDYRIRIRSTTSRERTASGWHEYQFQESIHDPTLSRVVQSRTRVDDTRIATTRYVYDEAVGVVEAVELPESFANNLGQLSSIAYDAHKVNAVTTVNAAGHVTTRTYDLGSGALLTSSGPQYRCPVLNMPCIDPYRKYRLATFRYDGMGRLRSRSESVEYTPIDYELVEVERHTYHDWNGVWPALRRTVSESRVDKGFLSPWTRREVTIDGLGRTVRDVTNTFDVQVPDAVRTFQYDARGLVTMASAPDPSRNDGTLASNYYTYDGLGRLTAISHSSELGGVRRITRDGLWTETSLVPGDDGPAARVRYRTDVFGRIVRVEERTGLDAQGAPAVTEYGHDANGYLTSILDADGLLTRLGNDRGGNRLWIERGGQRWDYTYDLQGRVRTATVPHPSGDASAYTSETVYDAIGRIERHVPGPGALTAAEQAELGVGPIVYVYDAQRDAIGLPNQISSPVWTEDYTYDTAGRTTSIAQRLTIPGAPPDVRTVSSEYNLLGAPVEQTHADGNKVSYTYDGRGLVSAVAINGVKRLAENRNSSGLVTRRVLTSGPNQTQYATWDFDPLGRLRELEVFANLDGTGTQPIAKQTTRYFSSGDVQHVDEQIAESARSFDFTYDHQSQLRIAEDDRGYRGAYDYTPNGRLLLADVALPATADLKSRNVVYDYDVVDPEQLRAMLDRQSGADVVRLTHDRSGNTTSKASSAGNVAFRYDAAGKLRLAVRDGERERYYYDAGGRRIFAIRTSGGALVESRRIVDDLEIETRPSGTTSRLTISAGTPFARMISGNSAPEFVFQNASGNLLVATNDHEVLAGFSYGAFGEILEQQFSADLFERRYQDRERDTITGWYDYGFRLYDPETMLWNRSDPLYRFAPDAAGAEPRRLGLYTFSLNNPLRYVDADGRDPVEGMTWIPDSCMFMQCNMQEVMEARAKASVMMVTGAIRVVDVFGVHDAFDFATAVRKGDRRGAVEAAAWWFGPEVAGLGIGQMIKGLGNLAELAGKLNRLSDGLAGISKKIDDLPDMRGMGWDADVAARAITRTDAAEVIGQGFDTARCAPTCVRMVSMTITGRVNERALYSAIDRADANDGLVLGQITDAMKAQGFGHAKDMSISGSKLERLTARGTPVIAEVKVKGGGLHAVVVDGVMPHPHLGKLVSIRDPLDEGSSFLLRYAFFRTKWTGNVVVPMP